MNTKRQKWNAMITWRTTLILAAWVGFGSWLSGCQVMRAEFRKTDNRSLTCNEQMHLDLTTNNGSIIVRGAQVAECTINAEIIAKASTETAAEALANKVDFDIQQADNNQIIVRTKEPLRQMGESVSVNFEVTIPEEGQLTLSSRNGAIRVSHVAGPSLSCVLRNGSIKLQDVSGDVKVTTHNGSVSAQSISGNAKITTHNGGIKLWYSADAPSAPTAELATHNGRIDLTCPKGLSAQVELVTHNGSIRSELPITISGKINQRTLKGTIGTGEGKLRLVTHNGSIHIR